MLTNASEICTVRDLITSFLPLLPHATMFRLEIRMMQTQALTNLNTTQARFGRSGYLNGGNQLNKHASKTQGGYTGWRAGSGMARRRDSLDEKSPDGSG